MSVSATFTSLLSVLAFEHFSEFRQGIKRRDIASVAFSFCTL